MNISQQQLHSGMCYIYRDSLPVLGSHTVHLRRIATNHWANEITHLASDLSGLQISGIPLGLFPLCGTTHPKLAAEMNKWKQSP